MTMSVRRCEAGDAQRLALIGAATFLESYAGVIDGQAIVDHCAEKHTVAAYCDALNQPDHALWLAEQAPGQAPVGYLHLTSPDLPVEIQPGDVEIKRIYVLASLHRSGLGRQFVDQAIEYARTQDAPRLLLGVYRGNRPALAFYERMGFEKVGERRFDVGGRIYDDWVLGKTL